jgi:hypothetical protein
VRKGAEVYSAGAFSTNQSNRSAGAVTVELRWLNCWWLMVPLLAWNLILAPQMTAEKIISDANSPLWLLVAENLTRVLVFGLPLLLPLQMRDNYGKVGLAIYLLGTLLYFVSWMPLLWSPTSLWSQSAIGFLAPRLTPFLPFLGIALVGRSLPYALVAVLFVFLHTWHGIQNLG